MPRKILRLIRQNIRFTRKLKKGLKPFFKRSAKCRDQENSILEIAGKAKEIKGDKLPKVTNLLVKSLNDRASPALGRVTTRVRVPLLQGPQSPCLGNKEMS